MLYIDSERTVALGGVIASDALCSDQVPPRPLLPPPSSPSSLPPAPAPSARTIQPRVHRHPDPPPSRRPLPIPGCEELPARAVADCHNDVRRAVRGLRTHIAHRALHLLCLGEANPNPNPHPIPHPNPDQVGLDGEKLRQLRCLELKDQANVLQLLLAKRAQASRPPSSSEPNPNHSPDPDQNPNPNPNPNPEPEPEPKPVPGESPSQLE